MTRPTTKPQPPRFSAFLAGVVTVLILGQIDYVTGWEFTFFLFYYIPIAVAAWTVGPAGAYVLALLSAVVWMSADAASGHPYSRLAFACWNAGVRFVSFMAIAYFVSRMRMLLDHERKISEDLRSALGEVRTLSGLIPICAHCKKIRNDQGFWQHVEEYVTTHSQAHFTHGLCQECERLFEREAGLDPREDSPPAGASSSAVARPRPDA